MTEMLVHPATMEFDAPVRPVGDLLSVAKVSDGVGFLDPLGLVESYNCLRLDTATAWPCPPTVMPAITQSASATATTGGTLAAGTYRAKVTAVNARGETVASNEISQVTTGAASTVTFNWPNQTGETGYRVYITNGAANSEAFYIERPADSTSYVMTAYPPAGSTAGTPPAANTAVVSVTKTFGSPAWQDGIRFSVYGGTRCKAFGMGDAEDKVRSAFEAMESVGVERALMSTRFIAGATWGAATDLTPAGGAVAPSAGLALLEGDAGCKYAGTPIIHAPRAVASMLSGVQGSVVVEGNRLVTKMGSLVAAGGGYACPNNGPTGAAPTAGELWMFASGQVAVARSELIVASDMDRAQNETFVLAERTYVAAVDCYTAAVRVKVP